MNSVGRPLKYKDENERKETRKIQNRENQRRFRKRKKLNTEVNFVMMNSTLRNQHYRNNIVKYQSSYEYDFFFTGTIDMKHNEKEKLKKINEQIRELNQILETNLSFHIERKIGINSIRNYTEKYIQYLSDLQLIERCFVVFERGKNHKYHVHIMFKSNGYNRNFINTTENRWLMGKSLTIPIINKIEKVKLLNYCVKELKCSSNKINDLNKIDNWFVSGNFNKHTIKVNPIPSTITI